MAATTNGGGRPRRRRGWRFPGNPRTLPARIARWIAIVLGCFVALSLAQVLLFKWVPVPVTLTMLFDAKGITKDWTPLSRIDPDMARAAIAGEDAKFCLHHGFDADAIQKAMAYNARGGRIRGGSTISQQTAKNVFLWQGGGFFRKGLEAWYTLLIEAIWGKRRIMEVYLNVAETGIGTYGVEAGAIRYFGHGADRLSRTEAARIAAVLPLPKKRAAIAPGGFTRRHGDRIVRYIGSVKAQGLDACLDLD
jgi:monofunctional biosynthetic peptidoglycan transglycosylase